MNDLMLKMVERMARVEQKLQDRNGILDRMADRLVRIEDRLMLAQERLSWLDGLRWGLATLLGAGAGWLAAYISTLQ